MHFGVDYKGNYTNYIVSWLWENYNQTLNWLYRMQLMHSPLSTILVELCFNVLKCHHRILSFSSSGALIDKIPHKSVSPIITKWINLFTISFSGRSRRRLVGNKVPAVTDCIYNYTLTFHSVSYYYFDKM